eukprot:9736385-Lingulodinium_polyedra.AAC.1
MCAPGSRPDAVLGVRAPPRTRSKWPARLPSAGWVAGLMIFEHQVVAVRGPGSAPVLERFGRAFSGPRSNGA